VDASLAAGEWLCYNPAMKYEVDLPADVDRQLSAKAAESGRDVVSLIRAAVLEFVGPDLQAPPNGQWSPEAENRRQELIDRDIAGTLGAAERAELAHLDRLANEHFDRVAPPPVEGARRFHEQLLRGGKPGSLKLHCESVPQRHLL
jgi:hypothetical protein